ncbi:hypothetical protein IC762_22110 [Bradyrhizobium genosp. L]|uniref:hypothetical protein n=1 Tax=Bradyrhizobium genosp. L TaxID=83637 RepID=UPI0018A2BBC4|nr:hypothetical protein [Bradyrhizobium genosp. L]QPF82450.1 hypothetical protein IC762_22110 [Bradyrhizobium genosp. L]
MPDVEAKPPLMTIILIAVLVFNVLGIGLSEIQRRQLGQQSFLAVLELRDIEKQRLAQQTVELDRIRNLIDDVDQRINKVQIVLESGPIALQVKGIEARVNALQIKMEEASTSK